MSSMLPALAEHFTTGSIKGNYAICDIPEGGHAQSASLGVWSFDGSGSFSGSIQTNLPGAKFGQRIHSSAPVQGTYIVDDNGSGFGSLSATIQASDDFPARQITAVLLIAKAETTNGLNLAHEFSIMLDAVDPITGGMSLMLASRHPDGGEFSLASFSGTYGGPGWGRGGQTPASAIGIGAVNFDGNGNFRAVDVQNLPGATFAERRRLSQDTPDGHYSVNKDGTGMVMRAGAHAHFVVTKAKVSPQNVKVALEYFFITDDLIPPTANLVTTRVTKRFPQSD